MGQPLTRQIEEFLAAAGVLGILLGGYFMELTKDVENDPPESQDVARGQRFVARWELRVGVVLLFVALIVFLLDIVA
ncbi:MAG: hypothetical protein QOF30_1110 [Acidimicrobiaceae bacterium]|nr:hypothetical protein [Acidimicrobiaceae bacterium]